MRTATPRPGLFDDLPAPPPPAFTLRFRPALGGRWRRVASVATHAQAVALVTRAGDWHIAPAGADDRDPGPQED